MADLSTLLLLTCTNCSATNHQAVNLNYLGCDSIEQQDQNQLSNPESLPCVSPPEAVSIAFKADIISRNVVRFGSRSEEVKELQKQLMTLGYYEGQIDGIYGSKTQESVIAFQRNHNLLADGIVGNLTWSELEHVIASKEPESFIEEETEAETENFIRSTPFPEVEPEIFTSLSAEISPPERTLPEAKNGTKTRKFPSYKPFYFALFGWAVIFAGGWIFLLRDLRQEFTGLSWVAVSENQNSEVATNPEIAKQSQEVNSWNQQANSSAPLNQETTNSNISQQEDSPNTAKPEIVEQIIPVVDVEPSQSVNLFSDKSKNQHQKNSTLENLETSFNHAFQRVQKVQPLQSGARETVATLTKTKKTPVQGELLDSINNILKQQINQGLASTNSVAGKYTLVAILTQIDSTKPAKESYSLIDDAEGIFTLQGNRLLMVNQALLSCEGKTSYSVTVRCTDALGNYVDKSLTCEINFKSLSKNLG